MSNSALASTNSARKKSGARLGAVYAESLPPLSPDDERGLEMLLKGAGATDAWRVAHPDTNCQPGQSEWSMAMRWRRRKDIQSYLDAATQAGINRLGETLADHVIRLHSLASESRRSGNYGAAIQAEVAIGRVQGHYVERTELTIRQGRSTDSVLLAIESLLGPEAAKIASMKLGIQYNQVLEQVIAPVDLIDSVTNQSINDVNQDQSGEG